MSVMASAEARDVFTYIYRTNFWRGKESRSGEGSGLAQTVVIRRELPKLILELGIDSILDAGCGDHHWLSRVNLLGATYIGADLVPDAIEHDQRYASAIRQFTCLDVVHDPLPKTDIILCRDVLVHLPYADCLKAIDNFKRSGATYLLCTTFINHTNTDLHGDLIWRPLNMQHPPFNFGPPMRLFAEEWIEARTNEFDDYRLGLWRLDDIEVAA